MIEVKQNVSVSVPVRLADGTGAALGGVLSTAVTATVLKSDGTAVALTVTASDWAEITTGAFSGTGTYTLRLPSTSLDLTGPLTYAVTASTAKPHIVTVKVVANEEADTKTVVDALRTDYTAVRAANLDNLDAQISSRSSQVAVDRVLAHHEGKWQIHVTGADANRLVIYGTDGVTPLKKFDLKDAAGDATFINPFTRTPVP